MGTSSGKVKGSFTGKKHKWHTCGKALHFSFYRYSFDTRICLRVHISPFSWINQNCIFKGQNPINLSTWMIKELSIIPNYLRLFTFVAGTHIFIEKKINGKIHEVDNSYYIFYVLWSLDRNDTRLILRGITKLLMKCQNTFWSTLFISRAQRPLR